MKRNIKNYLIFAMLLIYIILYKLYIFDEYMRYSGVITASFMLVLCAISILFLGYRKDRLTELKRNVIRVIVVVLVFMFLAIYGIGFITGFLNNGYSMKLPIMIDNIFAPLFIILFVELFRYVVVSANKDKKSIPIVVTILLICLELATAFRTLDFTSFTDAFYTLSSQVIPVAIKNAVLTYICFYAGYKSTVLYRVVSELYIYVMPVVPNLGEYLETMLIVILPSMLFIISYWVIEEYKNGEEQVFVRDSFRLIDVPIYFAVLSLICLISGYFPHMLMGIGSNSMSPNIKKGDAVIVEKASQDELKIGDVIAYRHGSTMVIHRLINIEKDKDKIIYKTKGDNNNGIDGVDIKYKDIRGIVRFKIPFIGYPTVWISELMNS